MLTVYELSTNPVHFAIALVHVWR